MRGVQFLLVGLSLSAFCANSDAVPLPDSCLNLIRPHHERSTVYPSGYFNIFKLPLPAREKALSFKQSADTLDCDQRLRRGLNAQSALRFEEAYDWFKNYVESCHDSQSVATAISRMGDCTADMEGDSTKWERHREWLKTILYLKLDDDWYCYVVSELAGTLRWMRGRGNDINGTLAVVKFMSETGRCAGFGDVWSMTAWNELRRQQHTFWKDTVTVDTNIYKIDTTLPSLEELGLGLLRSRGEVALWPGKRVQRETFSVRAVQNPFSSSLDLQIAGAGVTIQVEAFDALGKQYASAIIKETDRHSLDLQKLKPGTYFVRCESGGRTQTLKVIKE